MLTKPPVPYEQFPAYLPWVNACVALCLNSVLNVKVLGTFNQEKVLVGAFSVIVKSSQTWTPHFSNFTQDHRAEVPCFGCSRL